MGVEFSMYIFFRHELCVSSQKSSTVPFFFSFLVCTHPSTFRLEYFNPEVPWGTGPGPGPGGSRVNLKQQKAGVRKERSVNLPCKLSREGVPHAEEIHLLTEPLCLFQIHFDIIGTVSRGFVAPLA